MLVDATPTESGEDTSLGSADASRALASSPGIGSGSGAGGGSGSGIGAGTGSGIGRGIGGGFGGGAYRLGSGVVPPLLLYQTAPRYTADAMERRIQGTVALEAVISREGIPRDIRVTGSLDPGLDQEAMLAARAWRFAPGRLGDTAVDVVVTILLDFRLH